MNKYSADVQAILSGLDKEIPDKAKSLTASVVGSFEDQLLKSPLTFEVGEYEVKVEAKGSRENLDIYLSCTCGYWQYQGPEYYAKQNGYLFGKPKGTAQKPEQRDPNGTHKVCKHTYAVLRDYFGA